jgi:3-phosphoshikimate 1-carboxyvinyltransferase
MNQSNTPISLRASSGSALGGSIRVPGDKSISHRAVMLAGLARGKTHIEGLLESDDVMASIAAMRALGAGIARGGDGLWSVEGCGNGALLDPDRPLDLGNSGTGARLLLGLVAGQGLRAAFTGDASLRKRPMDRVLKPLHLMGARIVEGGENGCLPLTLQGTAPAIPIRYRLPVASAQVKSAILIAGVNALGATTVIEPAPTRDHTERMLRHFGAEVAIETHEDGRHITVRGEADLIGCEVRVPGDPSSAAFPLVAALIAGGSQVTIEGVMVNPTRAGLFATLREMGAKLEFVAEREEGGEPVADLCVTAGRLNGVEVPAERAPTMIDEYPALAVAAAFAEGETVMRGLSELRVKESDRLQAILDALAANGIEAWAEGDDLIVCGGSGRVPGGGLVATHMDHRIAMAFLVMGLASERPVTVDDAGMIATSFPAFQAVMEGLGGAVAAVDGATVE